MSSFKSNENIHKKEDCADAQADLSLRWAHSHFVGFVMARLVIFTEYGSSKQSTE